MIDALCVIFIIFFVWCFGVGLGLAVSKEGMYKNDDFESGFWLLANFFAWPIVVSYYICLFFKRLCFP